MEAEDWGRVWEVFEAVADLPPESRQGALDRACGRDDVLRQTVLELLAADAEGDTALDQPLLDRDADGEVRVRPWPGAPASSAAASAGEGEAVDAAASSAADELIGETVRSYRILRRIGQGGMSTVYLARRADRAYRRHVVVKVARRGMEDELSLARLRAERQILAGLDHPHIAKLFDGGTTQSGQPYFVMEHIEGSVLDEHCERHELSVDQRLGLFLTICDAVHHAHQNLVVHCDLKPSNILVTADGQPKLLDFGIAKLLNADLPLPAAETTATWLRILTPTYASPEQLRGEPITTASDVYSLGVLLYRLLCGKLPYDFKDRSIPEIERSLAEKDPPPPSEARREASGTPNPAGPIGRDLDSIVLKALRSSPSARYASVQQLAGDIARYRRGLPVEAHQGTWRYRAAKFIRRHRAAVGTAAALALLLTGVAAAMTLQSVRIAHERDQVRLERDRKDQVLSLLIDLFEFSHPYSQPGTELTVREALLRSRELVAQRLASQPDARAEVLFAVGSVAAVVGDIDAAQAPLEEALEIRQQLHGDRDREVARSLTRLAAIYKKQGDFERAEATVRRALDILEERVDKGDPARLEALVELVSLHCHRDQYEAALEPAQEALSITDSTPDSPRLRLALLEYLGVIENSRGRYAESAAHLGQALALRRRLFGDRHPAQLTAMNSLALSLRRQEKLDDAESIYREILELAEHNYGVEYSGSFVYLNNLAGVLFARGDYAGAEELSLRAERLAARSLGATHPTTLLVGLRRARAEVRNGKAAEVEEEMRNWRHLSSELPAGHWYFAMADGVLGLSLLVQGRLDEAEPVLVRSYLDLLDAAPHRYRVDALERLRELYEKRGHPEKLERYARLMTSPE